MEQPENQFYITLMSNASLREYPDNVLSAFTNKLARMCRVSENWVVGISEIFFNSFTMSEKMQAIPMDKVSTDEIEVFEPTSLKRARKKREQKETAKVKRFSDDGSTLRIIATKDYDIVLKLNDLKEICYKDKHANFSKFLDLITEKIVPNSEVFKPQITLDVAKKEIKKEIMRVLTTQNWETLDIGRQGKI